MRARLADSLDYLFAQAGDHLAVNEGAAAALTARIRSGRQSPHVFGAYYDLVLALDRDDPDAARDFAAELVRPRPGARLRIAPIQDRPADELDRYRRLFLDDPDQAGPIAPEAWPELDARIEAALSLLERGFPELHDEMTTLLSDIVIAEDAGQRGSRFGGASSFMLWGGVLLNAHEHRTPLETAVGLAHESGHNLLFGLCTDGPLVLNDDDERFGSPLREDARPMDGVVHATYVIARMHQTLARLLGAGVLDAAESEAARADMELHARSFEEGDRTVRDGAALTEIGLAAMEAARAYMAGTGGKG